MIMLTNSPQLYLTIAVLLFLSWVGIEGKQDVYITSQNSCDEYDLDDFGEINLIFSRFSIKNLDDCQIKIEADKSYFETCVEAKDLDLDDCGFKLEVHAGLVSSLPDKVYSCSSSTFSSPYCTSFSSVYIIVKKTNKNAAGSANLRVYPKKSDFDLSNVAETAVIGVYVIVGIVIGAIVLLVICVVVVICCCCKRRGGRSGTVYRNQQPASQPSPAGAYPQVQYTSVSPPQAAGYQPPPHGYQPPPQGYQPPPQGYQPPQGQFQGYQPQAGYPPPHQGYTAPQPSAGYQMAETQKMPSAPLLEKDPSAPPPYPGP